MRSLPHGWIPAFAGMTGGGRHFGKGGSPRREAEGAPEGAIMVLRKIRGM